MRKTDGGAPAYFLRTAQPADASLIRHRIWRERLDPTHMDWRHFIVAETTDGCILGFAQIKELGRGIREFGSLIVEPGYRNRGIGSTLLRVLVTSSLPPVYLLCGQHNVTYYRRLGFRVLKPSEMPTPLWRKWRIGSLFACLAGHRVVAMAYI